MNARGDGYAVLSVFVVICLVASTCALAGQSSDGKRDPDKPKDSSDQRTVTSVQQEMEVSDAEWKALLPHIMKVQELARELRDLRGVKAFDLPKPVKVPKELRAKGGPEADPTAAPPSSPSVAVANVNEKARELRALLYEKATRADDIRTKLATYRVARAEAEKQVSKELANARLKLTELLTARQELVCVVCGLLD